jgi:hypothetical protein
MNTTHLSLFAFGAFIPFFPFSSFFFALLPAFLRLFPPLPFFAVVFFEGGYGEPAGGVITLFECSQKV